MVLTLRDIFVTVSNRVRSTVCVGPGTETSTVCGTVIVFVSVSVSMRVETTVWVDTRVVPDTASIRNCKLNFDRDDLRVMVVGTYTVVVDVVTWSKSQRRALKLRELASTH